MIPHNQFVSFIIDKHLYGGGFYPKTDEKNMYTIESNAKTSCHVTSTHFESVYMYAFVSVWE